MWHEGRKEKQNVLQAFCLFSVNPGMGLWWHKVSLSDLVNMPFALEGREFLCFCPESKH